jgi:tRNA(His) guanylyltransferase
MKTDDFGDRMKEYEVAAETRLEPATPTYLRLDGRSFSKFTKGLPRPYDSNISWAMQEVTRELVTQFKPKIAFTQSDEISLGWFAGAENYFSGRIQKLTTVIASVATAKFMQCCIRLGGIYRERAMKMLPSFDARIFQVDEDIELINAFIWREQDCKKNAISMAARAHFSHKTLQGLNRLDMILKMGSIEVNYYDYPSFFRDGIWLERVMREVPITPEMKINPKFAAQGDTVMRSRIVRLRNPSWKTTADRLEYWQSNIGFFGLFTTKQLERIKHVSSTIPSC